MDSLLNEVFIRTTGLCVLLPMYVGDDDDFTQASPLMWVDFLPRFYYRKNADTGRLMKVIKYIHTP